MKKLTVIMMFLLVCFSACEDLLEEQPKMIAIETFYQTAEEIEAAIVPIYYQLQRGLRKNYHNILESQADWGYARGSYLVIHQFQGYDNTNINRVSDIWIRIYRAIRNTNMVILNAPDSPYASQEEINEFVAEARFMRAFSYFQLVRNWGGVPLRTERNMVDLDVPRATKEQVYELIVEDLLSAELYLPDSPRNMGRPSKTAVHAILTEVYLEMGLWAQAREAAIEVINSGRYALVPVSEPNDFYNIFGPNVNGTSEEIFYMKYNHEYGSEWATMGHHPSSPYLNGRGYWGMYTDYVQNKVIREWDDNDLRKTFNFYSVGPLMDSESIWFYKKFIDPATTNVFPGVDNPFYRYADILLFYAEADCRVNNRPTADGMEKLNQVRRRAYGLPPGVPSAIDYNASNFTYDTFLDLIVRERGYETIFEGKRFMDLRRMGIAAEVIKDVHGIDINESILLWPIPRHEIEYNDAIDESDQNPGY